MANFECRENGKCGFTDMEHARIERFITDGMPGVAAVTDFTTVKLGNAFSGGKSLHQVARAFRLPVALILFLAHKDRWREERAIELAEIQNGLKVRHAESKLTHLALLLDVTAALRVSMTAKIDRAYREGSRDSGIDSSELNSYLKAFAAIEAYELEALPSVQKVSLTESDKAAVNSAESLVARPTTGELLARFANEVRDREKQLRRSN